MEVGIGGICIQKIYKRLTNPEHIANEDRVTSIP